MIGLFDKCGFSGTSLDLIRPLMMLGTLAMGVAHSNVNAAAAELRVVESLEVGQTFAGTAIGATLLTHGDHQYVAYYDAEQQVTIAQRRLGSDKWAYRKLPLNARWNNHVAIKGLAIDQDGLLHLSGNMHAVPLVYWRTSVPYDCETLQERGIHHIDTLEPINRMVGDREDRVTYERFSTMPDGRLLFHYRYGMSGDGQEIHNVWNAEEQRWERLRDEPLFDGLGRMNAYGTGEIRGPDGNFHMRYMWRDTPDARTNHTLSYVWSEDFMTWRNAAGDIVELPLTPETAGVVVDPIAPYKGLINMGFNLGFDAQNRPIVSYHKYDEEGKSQIYNARWEADHWNIYQTSDWDWRWEFGGWGAIPCKVRAGSVEPTDDGFLGQPYEHEKEGSGVWKLDPDTLKPVGSLLPRGFAMPGEFRKRQNEFTHEDGTSMQVNWRRDMGDSGDDETYYLRWESLPVNRDRPRSGELPQPSMLMLYKMVEPTENGG